MVVGPCRHEYLSAYHPPRGGLRTRWEWAVPRTVEVLLDWLLCETKPDYSVNCAVFDARDKKVLIDTLYAAIEIVSTIQISE